MAEKKNKLGEYLIAQGALSQEQLLEALESQKVHKKFLGEILIDKGLVSEKEIAKILAEQLNLPFISGDKLVSDAKLKNIFPVKKLREWKVLPLEIKDDVLFVAVANPLDIKMLQEIKSLTTYKIKLAVATGAGITKCLEKWFGSSDRLQAAIEDIAFEKGSRHPEGMGSVRRFEEAVKDAPVVQLVNSMISEAIQQRASDIHFEPQKQSIRVRFRIDGVLHKKLDIPKDLQLPLTSRIKVISGLDISEMRKPQDGKMRMVFGQKEYDIRISTLPDAFGEKVVLRILDKESIQINMDMIGLGEEGKSFLKKIIKTPYGIVLVTGPTGSGKTTTLYSMLNQLNDETRNIVTVEDPVEYELGGITQTEVNLKAGYTFATGMRHILRQDPDVIMIGEIRDFETAEIAIQAALTGHLVLSTLHTNNAPGTITRLLDMNVEPFLIGASVIAVIAQRLVRKLCPHCAEPEVLSPELEKHVQMYLKGSNAHQFKKAKGCAQCEHLGYRGRAGIFEMMRLTPELKDLVLKKAPEADIERLAFAQGMKTLQADALQKASLGITSLEEAMRVTMPGRE